MKCSLVTCTHCKVLIMTAPCVPHNCARVQGWLHHFERTYHSKYPWYMRLSTLGWFFVGWYQLAHNFPATSLFSQLYVLMGARPCAARMTMIRISYTTGILMLVCIVIWQKMAKTCEITRWLFHELAYKRASSSACHVIASSSTTVNRSWRSSFLQLWSQVSI